MLYCFGGHGIHEVSHDDNGADQCEQDVEEFQVIAFYGFPHIGARADLQQDVVPSFTDGHEDGQQEDHDDDPFGEGDKGDNGAAFYTEDEADGQEHDVQDGDGFQAQGVAQVHQEIDAQHEEEFIADPPGQSKAGDQEEAAEDQGDSRRYGAGGQGAFAFCRVFPVVFAVPVVVYYVDAAGYEGKSHESERNADQFVNVEDLTSEEEWNKKE